MKIINIITTALLLTVATIGCAEKEDIIKIGHKNFTEQRITGQLLSLYLESKGFKTKVSEFPGTISCYTALKSGNIDLYAAFTGSIYAVIFKQTETLSVEDTFNYVKESSEKQDGITWLKPLGWNNTYVLSVRSETAKKYNLANISNLVGVSENLIIGCDAEFITNGLLGLKELYVGLDFNKEVSMDQGFTYAALRDGGVDVISSYSTDGRVAKFGLINLKDDKGFFPPYYATPVIKVDYAKKHPEVVKALEELGGRWTEADMQVYNLMVDEGETATNVARLMLQDVGLLENQ